MTWLLTLILLTAIMSWVVTHKYQEEIDALKEEHKQEISRYHDEIYDNVLEIADLNQKLDNYKRRKY